MFLVLACSCLCAIYWNQVLSGEWRCSWSSADRRCSNYIWVINNLLLTKVRLILETWRYIDGSVQERRNLSALAMELLLSCTNPSIWCTRMDMIRTLGSISITHRPDTFVMDRCLVDVDSRVFFLTGIILSFSDVTESRCSHIEAWTIWMKFCWQNI